MEQVHMTHRIASTLLLAVAAGAACTAPAADQRPPALSGVDTALTVPLDRPALEAIMGRAGAELAGGVLRFGMPRTDLQVTARGVRIKPAFALGSWLALKPTPQGALAMGDLVLLDTELEAVLSKLQEAGIEQSAIHHHLVGESPRLLYTHIHAMGDPARIATGVRAALALTGTPFPAANAALPAPSSAPLDLDTAGIAAAIGVHGTVNGGVYQFGVPRAAPVHDGGMEIPSTMGLATAINFQPTGGGKAAITGDFVMEAREVNPVLRTLRAHGIDVVSLHNHLLTEEPRLFFMHFWAVDDAVTLARGLRAALDSTASRR
jgi:hypothetical protein